MEFRAILQLSDFDKKLGFNPNWVLEDNPSHFENLCQSLEEISPGLAITIITGEGTCDDRIKTFASNHGFSVETMPKSMYFKHSYEKVIADLEEPWLLLVSAYSACLYVELFREVISDITSGDFGKHEALSLFSEQNHPFLVRKDHLVKTLAGYSEKIQDFPSQFALSYLGIKSIPFPYIPGELSNYSRTEFPDKTKQIRFNDLPYHLNDDSLFRPIIDSAQSADCWGKLKRDAGDSDYPELLKEFTEKQIENYQPPSIQVDFHSALKLIPEGHQSPSLSDEKLPPEKIIGPINELAQKSAVYKTYLQLGIFHDPVNCSDFTTIMRKLDNSSLKIGLHTRCQDITPELAKLIVPLLDEIFFYLGNIDAENYNKLFRTGDLNSSLEGFQAIRNEKLSLLHEIENQDYFRLPTPFCVPVIFLNKELLMNERFSTLYGKWKDWPTFIEDSDKNHGLKLLKQFHETINTAYKITILEAGAPSQKNLEAPGNYEPLNRFPCRRIKQALTILSDGRILPCDQDSDAEMTLGNITDGKLSEAWLSDKRIQLVQAHEQGTYDVSNACQSCSYWYQPVL